MNPSTAPIDCGSDNACTMENKDLISESLEENIPGGLKAETGIFTEFNAIIVCALVLIPMFLWSMKQGYNIMKNVPSAGLKTPVLLILMAPLLFQICNLLSLYAKDLHIPILTLICKAYIGVLFYAFYFLLREFVFFEHLL